MTPTKRPPISSNSSRNGPARKIRSRQRSPITTSWSIRARKCSARSIPSAWRNCKTSISPRASSRRSLRSTNYSLTSSWSSCSSLRAKRALEGRRRPKYLIENILRGPRYARAPQDDVSLPIPVRALPAVLGDIENHTVRVLELAFEIAVALLAEIEEELAAIGFDAFLRFGEIVDLKAEMVRADVGIRVF